MHSAAEWIATVPEQLTAREALPLIDVAIVDAKQAAEEIAARYHGTLPPPPWPMHAELVKAIEALEGGKKLLAFVIGAGHGDKARGHSDPQVVRLLNGGRDLYAQVAEMQKRMQGVKVEDLPGLAATAVRKAAETKIGGVLFVWGLLWALKEFGGDE